MPTRPLDQGCTPAHSMVSYPSRLAPQPSSWKGLHSPSEAKVPRTFWPTKTYPPARVEFAIGCAASNQFVRDPFNDDRVFPVSFRSVDVGSKDNAVSHLYRNITFYAHCMSWFGQHRFRHGILLFFACITAFRPDGTPARRLIRGQHPSTAPDACYQSTVFSSLFYESTEAFQSGFEYGGDSASPPGFGPPYGVSLAMSPCVASWFAVS